MLLGWLQWRAWAVFGAGVAVAVCAAGVTLDHTQRMRKGCEEQQEEIASQQCVKERNKKDAKSTR